METVLFVEAGFGADQHGQNPTVSSLSDPHPAGPEDFAVH
jgi:hypothetical protein